MNILTLNDKKGKLYYYNLDNVQQVCDAWEKNAYLIKHEIVEHKMPFKVMGVEVSSDKMYSLEVAKYQKYLRSTNASDMAKLVKSTFHNTGAEQAVQKLISLRNQTKKYEQTYFEKLEEINKKNEAYLKKLDNGIFWSKLTRDTGATLLVIGSSMIAAPAAVAVAGTQATVSASTAAAVTLTTGSALKGVAKYQDTGNIGVASVEFICELGVGVFGLKGVKAGMGATEELMVTLFVKMPAEASKSLVGGDTLSEAAIATLAEGFGVDLVKGGLGKLLKKTPIPGTLKTIGKKSPTLLKEFFEMGGKFAEGKASDVGKNYVKSIGNKKSKVINKDALKSCHISHSLGDKNSDSHDQFVRTYCISAHK